MQIGRALKNQIAEAIQMSPFAIDAFNVEEDPSTISLMHKPSKSIFIMHAGGEGFLAEWHMLDEPAGGASDSVPGPLVQLWLTELEHVLELPDLWAEFTGVAGARGALGDDDPNTPFDVTEQAEIAAWAADLEQNAAERYDLDDDQMKVLVGELHELVEASGRIGRKDWYKAAIGSFVGIVMNRVVEAPVAQQVLEGMVSTLGHLFGHPIPQLGPGPIFGGGP